LDAGHLFGVRAIEPEVRAGEAEAERAACTEPLVVVLGRSADVELRASRALEALAQEPDPRPARRQAGSIRSIETWV
jgi:hypothetical protein